jgi:chemotaxis receptor (MCP) glutamine deamidase CheD
MRQDYSLRMLLTSCVDVCVPLQHTNIMSFACALKGSNQTSQTSTHDKYVDTGVRV